MNKEFEPGQVVEHKLSREWVMVLSYDSGKKVYTCRTKSFDEKHFREFELQEKSR